MKHCQKQVAQGSFQLVDARHLYHGTKVEVYEFLKEVGANYMKSLDAAPCKTEAHVERMREQLERLDDTIRNLDSVLHSACEEPNDEKERFDDAQLEAEMEQNY